MRMSMLLGVAGLAACTPHLECPEELQKSGDWAAPTNSWPIAAGAPGELSETGCAAVGGFEQGATAADFRLGDQFGDEVSLWQFYGNVIVLDFSTMWCAPCAELAKEIDHTVDDYEAEGFTYLTMLTQTVAGEQPVAEDLTKWAVDNSISQPVLTVDSELEVQVMTGYAYPRILVVDRDMTVAVADVQPIEDAAVRAAIDSLL